MGKIKKKHLLKRIEELEKSVRTLMDIQAKVALKALERFDLYNNNLDLVDNEFFDRLRRLKVVYTDRDSVE